MPGGGVDCAVVPSPFTGRWVSSPRTHTFHGRVGGGSKEGGWGGAAGEEEEAAAWCVVPCASAGGSTVSGRNFFAPGGGVESKVAPVRSGEVVPGGAGEGSERADSDI